MTAIAAFELPPRLEAAEPPEARGLSRDDVRLLVAHREDGRIVHTRFRDLPDFLREGDLVVVNTSRTLPAALDARRADGSALALHLSTPLPTDGLQRNAPVAPLHWVVELRRDGARFRGGRQGETLELQGGASAELVARHLSGARLWVARLVLPEPLLSYLSRHGRPIRYRHIAHERPLSEYQTVYATEPGSAEMPSAGRPFTAELLTALIARGVGVAPIVLHTGVSSLERGERPYAERYRVPSATVRLITATRRWGGRVIAVGTTVVRALETVARADGSVHAGAGWTQHVVTPERSVHAVDGLITGWHEPSASHLLLLEAVAGREVVARSYHAALAHGYLWHEFGDAHLVLP